MKEVVETYRKGDAGAAMQKFATLIRLRGHSPPPAPDGKPTPEMREAKARMQRNMLVTSRADSWHTTGDLGWPSG